jgi:hypothetical protein
VNDERAPGGPAFWIGAAIGTAIAGFGVYGLLSNLEGIALTSWLKVAGSGLVAHDLLFAPLVVAGSVLLVRVVPPRVRAPVQVAAIVSGALIAVSIPVVHGAGRLASNPSLLPSEHYGARLLAALAVVWAVAAVAVLLRRRPKPAHDQAARAATRRSGQGGD